MDAATARKFNGMIGYGAQDISDVLQSPYGKRLVANTSIRYLLKLNDRVRETCEAYQLSAADAALIGESIMREPDPRPLLRAFAEAALVR